MPSANKTNRVTGETARVLLFDVETAPNLGWIWGKYEQNVLGDFEKERQIICFSWKWLGEKEVHVWGLPDFPGYKRNPDDNRALILELYKLYSKAEVIIGHNIDRFDDKRANTDFIKHGLPPPPPHKTVDTLKIARRIFDFNSNKLGDLGAFLKLGKKVKHWGFELWRRCMLGDVVAWALMKRYNLGDVRLLEKVYLKLRGWAKTHPDLNFLDGHTGCPTCRGTKFHRRGRRATIGGKVWRYQCQGCGAWPRCIEVKGQLRYY